MLGKRLHWIDNLKIYLSILVVIHHCGRAYGTWSGWWFIKEENTTSLITPFFALNAAFLMTIFFFIAAYFMPGSYDRKGQPKFGADRNKRLLFPLVFFVLVIMPVQTYFYYINFRPYEPLNYFEYIIQVYFGLGGEPAGWTGPNWPDINLGHIWFIEHLLFYGLFYVLIKERMAKKDDGDISDVADKLGRVSSKRESGHNSDWNVPFPENRHIILFSLLLGLITFIVRIWYPMNEWTGFLYFYQVEWGHWPHYLAFIFIGIAAYRHKWLKKENFRKIGPIWLIIAVICIGILIITSIAVPINSPFLQGGFTWTSLAYSVIEVFLMMGMTIGLVYFFQKYFDKSSKSTKFLSAHSYLVYLFHQPIVVVIQYFLLSVSVHPFFKFLITIALGLPISFLVAWLIKKAVPYARKYL